MNNTPYTPRRKPSRYQVVSTKYRYPIVFEYPVKEEQEARKHAKLTGGILVPPLL